MDNQPVNSVTRIFIGPVCFAVILEEEGMAPSPSKRRVFLGGDAEPSSEAASRGPETLVKAPEEVIGNVNRLKTSNAAIGVCGGKPFS